MFLLPPPPPPLPPLVGHTDQGYLWWSVWNTCLRTSCGMWCLRHAGALAWRRGPVCACMRVCWCRRICTYIHTSTSNGFALTWYRASTWYSSPARPFAAPFRDGRSATRYRVAREPFPRVPTAFQGSKCVRGELKRRKYQVKVWYQVRANPLLQYIHPLLQVRHERFQLRWRAGFTP